MDSRTVKTRPKQVSKLLFYHTKPFFIMSNPYTEEFQENEEEEREKHSFFVIHREHKEGKKIIYTDWVEDYEEEKLDEFIKKGLNEGYIIEIQKLKEDQTPIEEDDEPTDAEIIANNSVGICYHDGCIEKKP